MQASVPLWVYVLSLALGPAAGGIIALLGAFGGPWLQARTNVDQWHRDKRLDAYHNLAGAVHDLTEAITQRLAALDPSSLEDARQRVERATFELLRAAGRVQLVGPPLVRNASVELAEFVATETRPLRGVPATGPYSQAEAIELATINEGLNHRYNLFMVQARYDLFRESALPRP